MGFHIDWTVNITTLFLIVGALFSFFKVFLWFRDIINELARVVGKVGPPPTGMQGDIHHIKIEQRAHRDWLVRAGYNGRLPHGKEEQ